MFLYYILFLTHRQIVYDFINKLLSDKEIVNTVFNENEENKMEKNGDEEENISIEKLERDIISWMKDIWIF